MKYLKIALVCFGLILGAIATTSALADQGHGHGGGGGFHGHGGGGQFHGHDGGGEFHGHGGFHGDHDGFHGGFHDHFGVFIGGAGFWPWYFPGPYYDNPYYGYPYSYYYPPAAVPPPVAYEEEQSEPEAISPSPQRPSGYWYYCSDPKGYYPYVKQCAPGWERVSPEPPGAH